MYSHSKGIWKQYTRNIAAVNHQEALYLLHYLTFMQITRNYLQLTEIVDLQRYRLIKDKKKIHRILLQNPKEISSFLFPINKN